MTLEFCLLMIQRGYIKHLSAAAEHYRRLCGVADEIISLRVPFAPDEELAERLKARLADDGLIAHDIVDKAFFDVKLDRDLIGGFIAYYGGHQIDASIKTAITKFERLEGYAN
jgi:F0F1-type ATP synthase delta subunit